VRRLAVTLLCLPAGLAGGCGAEPAKAPRELPSPDEGSRRLVYPRAGISLSVPRSVLVERRPSPGVFRASSGESFVAAFAYRRGEQLPRTGAQLATARRRLVAEVRGRDGRFHLIRSRVARVAGAPAVALLGEQTLARSRLRTRSLHAFKGNGEYVIEMLAPVRKFERADRTFFSRVTRSLRLSGMIRPERRPRSGR
jgi:hypothetical protein